MPTRSRCRTCLAVSSLTLRAMYANALLWFDRRATRSASSTCTIGASLAAYAIGSLMTRGSATIVVCGTDTASSVPLRSKMLPRSAGMETVRTRCPTPSDARCERSRACRSKRRRPTPANASTVTRTMPSIRARMGGSGRTGRRFGWVEVRGRAGACRPAGRPWRAGARAGAGAARFTGARAAPRAGRRAGAGWRRAPRGSRLLGAKARLRLRPVRDCLGGRSVVGLGHRRTGHLEVLRRLLRLDQAELLGLLDHALRRGEHGCGEASLLVDALLLGDLRVEAVELHLVLREDHVEHDRGDECEHGDDREQRAEAADPERTYDRAHLRRRSARRSARGPTSGPARRRRAGARARAARGCGDRGHEPSRSTARRRALLARGLASTSASDGLSARRVSRRVSGLRDGRGRPVGTYPGSSVRDQSTKRSFTMRSSSEWYASTTTRPSGLRRWTDSSSPTSKLGSSRLTSMRIAWNVRRAGWPPRRRAAAGMPRFTASTSSPVVRTGRAATISDAMRRAKRSSPLRAMSAARSDSEYSLTTVSAVSVCTLSIRMSSGAASAQYEKPRTGRSSWGLLTPRSNKIATIPSFPTNSVLPMISESCSKPPCTMRTRSPKGSSAAPAAAT